MRIGVVTNFSAVDSKLVHLIDLLFKEDLNVVRVFTPEHGLYGMADGKEVEDSIHPRYKVPILSLYGKRRKPRREDFEDLDVVIYDIQDVGLRFFTYIYTLYYSLETASETGVKFIVLDRVNPLGRKVVGRRIPRELSSFVGDHLLPLRYGLTAGELSRYYAKLYKLDIDLEVSKIEGWRGETFSKTGLLWNMPSPNLPTYNSLLAYAGMVFLEGTNVSHGRGTTRPFEFVGAPWIDAYDLYEFMKERHPEISFRIRDFVPSYREYAGMVCHGLEFFPKEEDDFFSVAIDILRYLKKYEEFKVSDHLSRLMGVENPIESLESYDLSPPEDYLDFIEDIIIYR